ncbi:CGNR zinc finger domain-containing protein [Actinomadura parmotrematis]|nr:ABATE domain-containing protein [Actinomadura parmotrematis]
MVRFRAGAGRPSLDFVRTLRHRDTPHIVEDLSDAAALAAWVTQFGPCRAAPADAAPATRVGAARELREAVFDLVSAGVGGYPPMSGARERVNEAAARPVPAPYLAGDGGLEWAAADPVAATLSLVARDALDLVATGAVARVRVCAGEGCAALFYDGSRPGTRRWCSMDTCGNRAKKQTLRAKAGA